MASGFEAGKIYEVVYRAADPVVVGTGLAAVRDVVSWLKYDSTSTRADAPRHRLRRVADGALPPPLPVPGLQHRRARPTRVRRHLRAHGRRGAWQLQPPLRPAVARRAAVLHVLLSDRPLSVHEPRRDRPGHRRTRLAARRHAHRVHAGRAAEGLLRRRRLRVLGARGVAHAHHAGRVAPTSASSPASAATSSTRRSTRVPRRSRRPSTPIRRLARGPAPRSPGAATRSTSASPSARCSSRSSTGCRPIAFRPRRRTRRSRRARSCAPSRCACRRYRG